MVCLRSHGFLACLCALVSLRRFVILSVPEKIAKVKDHSWPLSDQHLSKMTYCDARLQGVDSRDCEALGFACYSRYANKID